jgi:hypothetical protein
MLVASLVSVSFWICCQWYDCISFYLYVAYTESTFTAVSVCICMSCNVSDCISMSQCACLKLSVASAGIWYLCMNHGLPCWCRISALVHSCCTTILWSCFVSVCHAAIKGQSEYIHIYAHRYIQTLNLKDTRRYSRNSCIHMPVHIQTHIILKCTFILCHVYPH